MPKKSRLAVAAALFVLLSVTIAVPAASASSRIYPTDYNQADNIFSDLQKIAGQHNGFVAYHKGHCYQESSKSWVGHAKKDVASVKTMLNALWKLSSGQRKKKVFRDLVKAERLLKGWGQGQILAKLNTCKKMPSSNNKVQQALQDVYTDLGNPNGY